MIKDLNPVIFTEFLVEGKSVSDIPHMIRIGELDISVSELVKYPHAYRHLIENLISTQAPITTILNWELILHTHEFYRHTSGS